MRATKHSFVVLAVTVFAVSCFGQDVNNSLNVGIPENGVFHGTDIETVQLGNGGLHIELPLWSVAGRGLSVGYSYIYDNRAWRFLRNCDSSGFCTDSVRTEYQTTLYGKIVGPLDYTVTQQASGWLCGTASGWVYTNYVLREPNGTKHHFVPDLGPFPPCFAQQSQQPTIMYADDGSGWYLRTNSAGDPQYVIAKN